MSKKRIFEYIGPALVHARIQYEVRRSSHSVGHIMFIKNFACEGFTAEFRPRALESFTADELQEITRVMDAKQQKHKG